MSLITQPRVLALVGMPGAGKTLCAQHLEDAGYFQFRFGSIITDEVERRGLPLRPDNERVVREEIRADEGMDAIARRALPLLRDALDAHATVVIDGLYSFSEYKTLQEEFGGEMAVVAIVAPRALRYDRLSRRPIRPLTAEEAELRDHQEIQRLEKGGPIAIADYTLVNDSEPEALLRQLEALLETLAIRP
jgi:dephospho-CoA kinase